LSQNCRKLKDKDIDRNIVHLLFRLKQGKARQQKPYPLARSHCPQTRLGHRPNGLPSDHYPADFPPPPRGASRLRKPPLTIQQWHWCPNPTKTQSPRPYHYPGKIKSKSQAKKPIKGRGKKKKEKKKKKRNWGKKAQSKRKMREGRKKNKGEEAKSRRMNPSFSRILATIASTKLLPELQQPCTPSRRKSFIFPSP
jgi:hypothetical protein